MVLIQEAHGTIEEVQLELHSLNRTHLIFCSPGIDRATGGLITLIKKDIASAFSLTYSTIVLGRLSRLEMTSEERTIAIYNLHSFGLDATTTATTIQTLKADTDRSRMQPENAFVLLAGDFNFLTRGDRRLSLERPENLEPDTSNNDGRFFSSA